MKWLKDKKIWILFGVLALIIFIRVLGWPNGIQSINVDEAMTAMNAKAIAETGKDIYGTSFPVYLEAWGNAGQSVMLVYIMAFFIKLFGFSLFTVRLPMLLVSLLSLFVFYDFTKRIFKNKIIGLFAMAFVALCPWHYLQSLFSLDCNMFPHFLLFSIYFLYLGFTSKKRYLYVSMILFGLTMYTYGIAVYVVPLFLLIAGIYLLIKKILDWKKLLICIGIYLVTAGPILVMYGLNFFNIQKDISLGPITIQYFDSSTRKQDMLLFSDHKIEQLGNNFKSLGQVAIYQYDGLEWNAAKYFGAIAPISIIFAILGCYYAWKNRKQSDLGMFFFTLWFVLSIFVGIMINGVNINRLNVIWYPLIFFTIYGIYFVYKKLKQKRWFLISIISMYTIIFIGFIVYFQIDFHTKIENAGCFDGGLAAMIEPYKDDSHQIFYVQYEKEIANIYIEFYSAVYQKNIILVNSDFEFDNNKDGLYIKE